MPFAGSKPEKLSSNSAVNEPVILSAEKVTCIFKVKKTIFAPKLQLRAVDKVSLDLHRTEVLALVGESGCGKTTLAKIMLGLEHNDSGDIFLEGKHLAQVSPKDRARIVQPIFQDPYSSLNPRRTIGETILLPLGVHNIGNQRLVEETMGLVGLSQRFFHRYPNQISGGQRQRVAIARALIMKPKILICDEPTSALDVSVQSQILNLLLDLREELGLSFLVITHDFGVVNYIADRIAVMYLGQIVEIGTREQIINTAKHPYTQALLKSVLSLEPGAGIPNINLGGGFPNPLDVPPGCPFHPRCPEAMDVCTSQIPELENTDNTQTRCWLVQKQSL
jgi:peptide/nickel transport system ATP-binding protein